jgi:hypothetical protein
MKRATTAAKRPCLLFVLLTAISFVPAIDSIDASDAVPVLKPPAGRGVVPDAPNDIEKIRMGRIVRIAASRIELVPVAIERTYDEPEDETRSNQVRLADDSFDQLVFGPGLKADDARVQAAAVVREKIAAIDKTCKLTDTQIKKLELAGRGDIERLLDCVDRGRTRLESYLISDGNVEEILNLAREARAATVPLWDKVHSDIYNSQSSLFAKTLRNVLTNEQAAKAGLLLPAQTDRPPLSYSLKAAAGVRQVREYRAPQ